MIIFLEIVIYLVTHISVLLGFKKPPSSLRCLTGKTAIVTGGNSGIGFAAATRLASRGCRVIIADCQNGEQSRDQIKAKTGNMDIVYKYLDLSSLQSVRSFSTDICKTEEKIDILVNNAGIGITDKTVSEDGLNYLMQINIFGAFLLTHLLLDPMKKSESAQVLFTSSVTVIFHSFSLESLNPINFQMDEDYRVSLYSNSKVCNILAAQEFGRKLEKYGITVNSIDPVGARTDIFRNIAHLSKFIKFLLQIGLFFFAQDMERVAESYLYILTKNGSDIPTGRNYVLSSIGRKPAILKNGQFCEDVWLKLEELVKLRPEEKITN